MDLQTTYIHRHITKREMPYSPVNLQTDTVRRHFTESGGNALTDEFTDEYSPSVFNRVVEMHTHR